MSPYRDNAPPGTRELSIRCDDAVGTIITYYPDDFPPPAVVQGLIEGGVAEGRRRERETILSKLCAARDLAADGRDLVRHDGLEAAINIIEHGSPVPLGASR